jgi:hypothetical protein
VPSAPSCIHGYVKKAALGQTVFNFAVLALLAGTVAGVGWLFALAIREGATLLGAFLVGFATVAAALIARHFDRRKEIEAARREHIGSLYEDLASVYAAQDMTDRKREKMIVGFVRKSLIYASPGTLKAFHKWRVAIPEEDAPRHEWRGNALRYENFIKAMRKDLGISNWMLDDGDLGRVATNDFDEYFGDGSPEVLAPPEGDEVRLSAVAPHAGVPSQGGPRPGNGRP